MTRQVDKLVLETLRDNVCSWLSLSTGASVVSFNYPDFENKNYGQGGAANQATISLPQISFVVNKESLKYNNYYPLITEKITSGISTEQESLGEYHAEIEIGLHYRSLNDLRNAKNTLWANLLLNKHVEINSDDVSGFMRILLDKEIGWEDYKKDIKCYYTCVHVYAPMYYESTGYTVNRVDFLLETSQQTGIYSTGFMASDKQFLPINPAFRRVVNADNLEATFAYASGNNLITGIYTTTGEVINDLQNTTTITEIVGYAPDVTTGLFTVDNPIITGYEVSLRGVLRPDFRPNFLTKWQLCQMSDDLVHSVLSLTGAKQKIHLYTSSKHNLIYQVTENYADTSLTTITGFLRTKISDPLPESNKPDFTDYQCLLNSSNLTLQESSITGTTYTSTGQSFYFVETITSGNPEIRTRQKWATSGGTLTGDVLTGSFDDVWGLYSLILRAPDLVQTYNYSTGNLMTGSTLISSGFFLTGQLTKTYGTGFNTTTVNVTSGSQYNANIQLLNNFITQSSYNEFALISGTISPYVENTTLRWPIMSYSFDYRPVYLSNGLISSVSYLLNLT